MSTNINRPCVRAYLIFISLLAAVLFNACKQPAKAPAVSTDTVLKPKSTAVTAPAAGITVADTAAGDECPRGVAQPVVKKDIFPDVHFTLQPDHRSGMETLSLTNGDRLIIKQSGCEYYILSFRFETSRFTADTTNVAYWSNAALLMLRQVAKGLDVPLEIGEALNKLSARLEKDRSGSGSKLMLNEEIDFGGPDPRQYLTIDRITRLADQRHAIEMSLSYGPI